MRLPRTLRARITLAAVLALALGGVLAAALLLAAVERDGRGGVDRELRSRAQDVMGRGRGPGPGPFGRGRGGGERLLAGTGTFARVALGDQVVEQGGDVPADPPAVPEADGLSTIRIDGVPWRSLTVSLGGGGDARLQVLSSLAPVQQRVARVRRLVLLLGLAALAVTGLAAWAFTTLAVRPLARLRAGAAQVSGAGDLGRRLPEEEGPDEVRSLARTLNEMLARLRASGEETERALAATRRFAADAGHELRTPLTGLRANLDALARNPALPLAERQALLAETTAEQERVVHLLEGLQALARGDAAQRLAREEVEVADLVDEALHGARRRHPPVRYQLEDLAEHGGEPAVPGWPGGLRLVIDNLLDNAALHGRPDGRVVVGLRRENGSLVVRVDDDGPGIPAGEAERLLEPFARGAGARSPGSGLGLAIVAQQVALHEGDLSLERSPLGGLGVEVRLPVASGSGRPPPTASAPRAGDARTPS